MGRVWISVALTLDINNPKAPPNANPIPPDRTVLKGQLSMAPCICGSKSVSMLTAQMYCSFALTALIIAASWSLIPAVLAPPTPPPPGIPGKLIFNLVADSSLKDGVGNTIFADRRVALNLALPQAFLVGDRDAMLTLSP